METEKHKWTLHTDLDSIEGVLEDLRVEVGIPQIGESLIVVKQARVFRATKQHATLLEAQTEADRLLAEQPRDTFLIFRRVAVIEPKGADTEGGGAK